MTRPGGPALVIPVKATIGAKQRLSGSLDAATRRMLALAMAGDVLRVATAAVPSGRIVVVAGDAEVQELAGRLGVASLLERGAGQSAAARAGVRWAIERGHTSVAVLAADLPFAEADDVERLLDAAAQRGRLLAAAPDVEGTGTNAAALRPLDVDPWRFGVQSLRRHRVAAAELRLRFAVLDLPSLRVDVDRPADLERVIAAPRPTATFHLLRQLGLAPRVASL
jgi:2-phospho-L-lactate guanylyltransferase